MFGEGCDVYPSNGVVHDDPILQETEDVLCAWSTVTYCGESGDMGDKGDRGDSVDREDSGDSVEKEDSGDRGIVETGETV